MKWLDRYVKEDFWGMTLSLDLFECDIEKIDSEDALKEFAAKCCKITNMKPYGDCLVYRFGSGDAEGLSFTQLVETSLISGHFAPKLKTAYIDIFTCKPFDPDIVSDFTKIFFGAKSYRKVVNPRFKQPI